MEPDVNGQLESDQSLRILELSGCTVDLGRHCVEVDGVRHRLGSREAELLGYLAGRPGEAVTREELLEEVWGYSRDAVTRVVDKAVCRLRQLIGEQPTRPVHLVTVQGVGYRFEPVAEPTKLRTGLPTDQGTSGASRVTEQWFNIPEPRTSFVGRSDDLQELERLFQEGHRLVTLLGSPGSGKTRLAKEYARQRHSEGGALWYCDLGEARTASDLVAILADQFSVSLAHSKDPNESARAIGVSLAARGRFLVILDNFEQLVSVATEPVDELLRQAPSLDVLVTSREALWVAGEVCFDVEPLLGDEAVALFLDRAATQRREFKDDAEVIGLIRLIVVALDGLPLAIELAAPLLRLLTPAQMLRRLSGGLDLLRMGGHGMGRQASLRNAIQWSWDLLAPWEQDILGQCAVFRGSFSLEAAEAVVKGRPGTPSTLDVLALLRGKSLLQVCDGAAEANRLRMFETVREFAWERARESGDVASLRSRHRKWFLAEGEKLARGMAQSRGVDSLTRLLLDKENLLAVHREAGEEDAEFVVRAALALDVLLARRGPLAARMELLDAACEAARTAPDKWRARAHVVRGEARLRRGGFEEVEHDLRIARDCAVAADDRPTQAQVLGLEGTVRMLQGRISDAEVALERAANVAIEAGDLHLRGDVLGRKGALLAAQGRKREAHRLRRDAVAALQASRHRHGEVMQLAGLALELLQIRRGETPRPELVELVRSAWQIARQISDRPAEAVVLRYRALLHTDERRFQQAEEDLERCRTMQRRIGDLRETTRVLRALADVRRLQGQFGDAEVLYRELFQNLVQVPDERLGSEVRASRVANLADRDQIEAAEMEAESGPMTGPVPWQLHLDLARARFQLSEGEVDAANRVVDTVIHRWAERLAQEPTALESSLPLRLSDRLFRNAVERSRL